MKLQTFLFLSILPKRIWFDSFRRLHDARRPGKKVSTPSVHRSDRFDFDRSRVCSAVSMVSMVFSEEVSFAAAMRKKNINFSEFFPLSFLCYQQAKTLHWGRSLFSSIFGVYIFRRHQSLKSPHRLKGNGNG